MSAGSKAITIVGGGFSGCAVAVQLLRRAREAIRVKIVERRGDVGRGIAYGTEELCHLLNVPARRMSLLPEQAGHFVEWLGRGRGGCDPGRYVPRKIYGEYVQSCLEEARRAAPSGSRLETVRDEVLDLECLPDGALVRLASGAAFPTDRVVLALGNSPPVGAGVGRFQVEPEALSGFVNDTWSREALEGVSADAPVVLLGTGLTMVDHVLSLHERGHRAPIHAVSRHGRLPLSHRAVEPLSAEFDEQSLPKTTLELFRAVRARVNDARAAGADWRAAFDALRPWHQKLWRALPLRERQRFLRHVVHYWNLHRHRIAFEAASAIETVLNAGQLAIHAGKVERVAVAAEGGLEVTLRLRGGDRMLTLAASRVIDCTGPNYDFAKMPSPLVRGLLERGLGRTHPLGLGLEVAASGALIGRGGQASPVLYTLGPPCIGEYWESTAVPEVRQQAAELAATLLRG